LARFILSVNSNFVMEDGVKSDIFKSVMRFTWRNLPDSFPNAGQRDRIRTSAPE